MENCFMEVNNDNDDNSLMWAGVGGKFKIYGASLV